MAAPARIGSTLGGKYRVDRLLGEGGMGVVYEATRVEIGDRVAVKLMLHDAARSPERVSQRSSARRPKSAWSTREPSAFGSAAGSGSRRSSNSWIACRQR